MKRFAFAAPVLVALLTASCGGGGGGSSGGSGNVPTGSQTTPGSDDLSISGYAGSYLSTCESVNGGVNVETNAALYGRTQFAVASSAGSSAKMEYRIDLYDNSTCAESALGYVLNQNPLSKVTVVGKSTVNGKNVARVLLSIGATDTSTAVSVSPSTVVIGASLRLSLPAAVFAPFEIRDIWLLDGNNLFEGDASKGPDGYPGSLDISSPNTKLSAPLGIPPAPCPSQAASWTSNASTCNATLAPTVSGTSALLADLSAPTTGSASFTCSNGVWSAAMNATCSTSVPAPPPVVPPVTPTGCAAGSVTWTVGANTCSGQLEYRVQGSSMTTLNIAPTSLGFAVYACNNGNWEPTYSECSVRPPPPPPLTDPLTIATQKNCLACHSVSNPATSVGGVSFQVIADHYRTTPPTAGVLEAKVKQGGSGTFGTIPMNANPQISDNELAILIPWILSR